MTNPYPRSRMRYFLDTEFYEFPHGDKPSGMIELISIGIVSEDGRSFYAESQDFNWDYVERLAEEEGHLGETPRWLLANVRPNLKGPGHQLSRDELCEAILEFAGQDSAPEFWAYFGDYDWVIFCWIFGRMLDLPPNFPMYCRDLKQTMDMYGFRKRDMNLPERPAHDALADAQELRDMFNWVSDRVENHAGLLVDL